MVEIKLMYWEVKDDSNRKADCLQFYKLLYVYPVYQLLHDMQQKSLVKITGEVDDQVLCKNDS